jgi:hypothetical protein
MPVEGQNQQSRNDKATEFQGGTVHLNSSSNAISDSTTTISSNASATTADTDWSISHDNTNGVTTLENVNEIEFGSPSGFVIDQIVIESPATTGNFIIDNSPTGDTDLAGDGSVSFPAGDLTYTFGGE